MLSILIPIYNYKVVKLVDVLQKQCEKAKIAFEILAFDDQSKVEFKNANGILRGYFGVNYTELSRNLGRAKIRNWLAKSARYEHLLFLDCDSKIRDKNFIKTYAALIDKYDVVSGGRGYSPKPPRAYTKKLHWLYGTKKETQNAAIRNKYPIKYFHSNNFLVKRNVILDVPFLEEVKGYGYEDLHLAKAIIKKGYKLQHVDNQIEHLGLEKNKVFLEKTRNAINNLLVLKYTGQEIPTNLENLAVKLQDWGFHQEFIKFYQKRSQIIEKNLLSKEPRLLNLDFYKLNYYFERRNLWIDGKIDL